MSSSSSKDKTSSSGTSKSSGGGYYTNEFKNSHRDSTTTKSSTIPVRLFKKLIRGSENDFFPSQGWSPILYTSFDVNFRIVIEVIQRPNPQHLNQVVSLLKIGTEIVAQPELVAVTEEVIAHDLEKEGIVPMKRKGKS